MKTKTEKHLLTESDMQTLIPDLEKTVNDNTLSGKQLWKINLVSLNFRMHSNSGQQS